MVIKTEMYPGGGYKQMSYSHEEEKLYNESYSDSNSIGSSKQMVRPNNPCFSTPKPSPHSHLFAGAGHQHNKEKMHDYREKHHHNAHGHQNCHGNERMVQETTMFSSDRMVSGGHGGYGTHAFMAPNKHETIKHPSGGDRRVHYFELKNLDD